MTTHVKHNSGNDEWYTPLFIVKAARYAMHTIDLDPASTSEANKVVCAKRFFTHEQNGLLQHWSGRIWMNPPYSSKLITPFAAKLNHHVASGDVTEAIILVNNATETKWFKALLQYTKAICFTYKRVRFWGPDGVKKTPLQAQAILYIGPNAQRFNDIFNSIGWIAIPQGIYHS